MDWKKPESSNLFLNVLLKMKSWLILAESLIRYSKWVRSFMSGKGYSQRKNNGNWNFYSNCYSTCGTWTFYPNNSESRSNRICEKESHKMKVKLLYYTSTEGYIRSWSRFRRYGRTPVKYSCRIEIFLT